MKKILFVFIGFTTLFQNSSEAQTSITTTATTKATATLAAECTISAQNVNFGQVVLPVNAQTATSTMTIQCTKGSAYTIGLAYGGVYGQGNSAISYLGTGNGNYWIVTSKGSGSYLFQQYQNGTLAGQQQLSAAGTGSYNTWSTLLNNPDWAWGDTGTFQSLSTKPTATNPAYSYGKMTGVTHGDAIAYSIQVPNQPSEVWNAGENNYAATATGLSQSIPVVVTLVPSETANQYPMADSYLDTVTATIGY